MNAGTVDHVNEAKEVEACSGIAVVEDSNGIEETKEDVKQTGFEPSNNIIDFTPSTTTTPTFVDHYSLVHPSNTVRFRHSAASHHVYEGTQTQFVLEESPDDQVIVVKRARHTTSGVYFLRAGYTIVAVLWTGFLFVFCVMLLLFLMMDLAVYLGVTTGEQPRIGAAIGTFLSLPIYVNALASALIIAGQFVLDTWGGQNLLKRLVFGGSSHLIMSEWISFLSFLGCPLLVMCITLLCRIENWWTITALFWFTCVSVLYLAFAAIVIYYEVTACVEIVRNRYDCKNSRRVLLKHCVLLRQRKTYSGIKTRVYLTRGTLDDVDKVPDQDSSHYHLSLYSRLTRWNFLHKLGFYQPIDDPGERIYTVEDALGIRQIITYSTWTLDRIYCRPHNSRYVAVVEGPAALSRAQMRSSFACAVIGIGTSILLPIAVLVWLGATVGATVLMLVMILLCCLPSIRSTRRVAKMTNDIAGIKKTEKTNHPTMEDDDFDEDGERVGMAEGAEEEVMSMDHSSAWLAEEEGENEGVFQVCETYRITRATDRFCWAMMALEVVFLFLWPVISIYYLGNAVIGTVYLFLGLFSLLRHYLNAAVCLEDFGSMRDVRGENEFDQWKNRSRLNEIMINITQSRSRMPWLCVLGFFLLVGLLLLIGGLAEQDPQTSSGYEITALPGFRYERGQNTLAYPTCNLDFNTPEGPASLVDFAFLAASAYESNDTKVQEELDDWFGAGVASDRPDVVSDFRDETDQEVKGVSYKYITFQTATGSEVGVISVRGSQNAWDWFTNAQLWSPAIGMEFVSSFLPFGFIWNPIMDNLLVAISILESESIGRVSFYKETSAFVRWLQKSEISDATMICGHSLGAGLAMITGAQTSINAIGFSGPNEVMSRLTREPPFTEAALDNYTFNLIPERDIVPMVGGKAKLYQNIHCTAPYNEIFECHDILRSLCEIMFACGSGDRPAICECVTKFGYPEPTQVGGNELFAEACRSTSP